MFSQPGRVEEGLVRQEFINQVDMFPTLLEYLGLGELEIRDSPGKSFAALLTGDSPQWDDTAFFEFVTVRVVRTQRWKYMKRFDTEEPNTLFDLINDPDERHNLIDDPAHAEVATELDRRLAAFFSAVLGAAIRLVERGIRQGDPARQALRAKRHFSRPVPRLARALYRAGARRVP